jgi:hypothetical protein
LSRLRRLNSGGLNRPDSDLEAILRGDRLRYGRGLVGVPLGGAIRA